MGDKKNKGYFIISLDFELHWGLHDILKIENNEEKFKKARIAVDKMLDLFFRYDINATWAAVGFLFAEDKEELLEIISQTKKPGYKNKNYSPYGKIEEILGSNEQEDASHYANSLIRKIKNTKGQELASHTFSHYYAWEEGQNIDEFESDLKSFLKVSEKEGAKISSIVFPRNQVNYIPVLKKYGITNYRGNPEKFYSGKGRIREKIGRMADTYLPLTETAYCLSEVKEEGLNNIKASRFLRPYSEKLFYLEKLKMRRIKKEMEYAAKEGKVYHLWWHPHNFSENLEKNLKDLEEILIFHRSLKEKYNFESINMEKIGEMIDELL